jgi:hypothetical protein
MEIRFVWTFSLLWSLFNGIICEVATKPVAIRKSYSDFEKKSPFFAHLANCENYDNKIVKKDPKIKGILCPMFRDEEGFLTEWIAFYQMMGFDHILFFDDGSTDKSLEELQPWIDVGFVSVNSNWSIHTLNIDPKMTKIHFKTMMAAKALLETECKLQAIEWGYHYFVSLDLDEYMFPLNPKTTIVDELHRVMTTTGRNSYCFDKYAFPAAPHFLEPIDLLTIEAYQSRGSAPNSMNYYTTTAKKCAYPLHQLFTGFTETTQHYIAECCRFHGCESHDIRAGSSFCVQNRNQSYFVQNRGRPWVHAFQVNHYARSFEKFALKQKTWRTSGQGTTEVSNVSLYFNLIVFRKMLEAVIRTPIISHVVWVGFMILQQFDTVVKFEKSFEM